MHIYAWCPLLLQSFTKFCGVALTNCFSSIFHFGQISKLQKGIGSTTSKNKNSILIFILILNILFVKYQYYCFNFFSKSVFLNSKFNKWNSEESSVFPRHVTSWYKVRRVTKKYSAGIFPIKRPNVT